MRPARALFLSLLSVVVISSSFLLAQDSAQKPAPTRGIAGFHDPAAQRALDDKFIAVPEPKLAEEHLRTLTAKPHLAGTPAAHPSPAAQRRRNDKLSLRIKMQKTAP